MNALKRDFPLIKTVLVFAIVVAAPNVPSVTPQVTVAQTPRPAPTPMAG
jgi:hypothetical protein